MAKGDPKITQAPTQSPQQAAFFNYLLQALKPMLQGFQLGTPYGGPSASSYNPITWGQSGGTQPTASPITMSNVLTKPFVQPFTEGMTGNYAEPQLADMLLGSGFQSGPNATPKKVHYNVNLS